MRRCVLALFLAAFVAVLVLPEASLAGPARVRTLAGGDERLLPYDDGNIYRFPNRINEHQRIVAHNISPTGSSSSIVSNSMPFEEFQNSYSWLESSWETMNGTAALNLNRPTGGSFLQLASYQRLSSELSMTASGKLTDAAHSMVEIGYANDGFGFWGGFGLESAEDRDSNYYIEGAFGKQLGNGMEIAIPVGFSRVLEENAFAVGLEARGERGDGFFNHWTGSAVADFGQVANDSTGSVNTESVTTFAVDLTAFHYAEGQYASGLTTLVGIGTTFATITGDAGGESPIGLPAKASLFAIPNVTGGAEYAVVSWLDISGSVTRNFNFTFGDGVVSSTGAGDTYLRMGAAAHWGRFRLESELYNEIFESGPDFIGGDGTGLNAFISAYYMLN